MKKLFRKDEIWFAVMWIVIYVMSFSAADGLSESLGVPKLLTVCVGALLAAVLLAFIDKNGLREYFGLCMGRFGGKAFLWFVPLLVISSASAWGGLALRQPLHLSVLAVAAMCLVGLLEEVIFRGLLFKAMCRTNVKMAIIVSSLTFGVGHIVNLLMGAPLLDTLLQLVYASAVGFCYTAIFYVGGSIWPCILSHAVVNSLSVFAVEPTDTLQIVTAAAQTVLGIGYGAWILHSAAQRAKKTEGME